MAAPALPSPLRRGSWSMGRSADPCATSAAIALVCTCTSWSVPRADSEPGTGEIRFVLGAPVALDCPELPVRPRACPPVPAAGCAAVSLPVQRRYGHRPDHAIDGQAGRRPLLRPPIGPMPPVDTR